MAEGGRIKFEKISDTIFAFKISCMELGDCGNYNVMASNDIGQRSEQFAVLCDSPPQISRGLDPETEKKLSNDHTFEVRASGSPTPVARWYKDGKEIMGDEKFRMVKDDNFYMLKIRKLDRKDKGVYKLVLSNASGEAETEGSLVIRAPPEFLTPLKDACAKEGAKDIKMLVEFQANPKPAVKWTFNGKPIRAETEGFTIKSTDTTSMLVIACASPAVVGGYSVTLSNEYGDSVGSAKFRLHEAPLVLEPLKDQEFLEGGAAKIALKVSGVPVPEIKWTKDGKSYTGEAGRVVLKKEGDEVYVLWTDDAKTCDSGRYVAHVSNCEGGVTSEASYVVNTPPHVLGNNFSEGKKVVAMHKFVLEVEATAVPEAEATWFLNNKELTGGAGGVALRH
ncbi:obscurin, partial [Hyalella azteca]|uniref:Obscurin n=1 Tax=Hyalella azteca TaxID=294128 RepID=A0A8B7NRB3_HYAAZ